MDEIFRAVMKKNFPLSIIKFKKDLRKDSLI